MAKNKKNHNSERSTKKSDERTDRIEFKGTVTEALRASAFKVQLDDGPMILARLAGKLRQHKIKVLPGDSVTVEVSPYDVTNGRITWRGR